MDGEMVPSLVEKLANYNERAAQANVPDRLGFPNMPHNAEQDMVRRPGQR
jgi:hypothetical protein